MRFLWLCLVALVWPALAAPRPEMVLQIGHGTAIYNAAISPSLQRIATIGEEGTLKIWDAANGDLHLTLECEARSDVAFSRDGRQVMAAGYRAVRVWDLPSGKLRHEWPLGRGKFSPDATRVAVPIRYQRGSRMEIWDTKTGARLQILSAPDVEYANISVWSSDGALLAVADYGGDVTIWRAAKNAAAATPQTAPLQTIDFRPPDYPPRGHKNERSVFILSALAFSPGNQSLAAAGSKGAVYVATIADGRIAHKLQLVPGVESYTQIPALLFGRDGKTLLTANQGAEVQIWNVAKEGLSGVLKDTNSARSLSWSQAGSTLLLAGYKPPLALWDVRNNAPKKLFPHAVFYSQQPRATSFSHAASLAAASVWQGQSVLWDWNTLSRYPLPRELQKSSNGNIKSHFGVLSPGAPPLWISVTRAELEWWRLPSESNPEGELVKKLALPAANARYDWQSPFNALLASPNGKKVAAFTDTELFLVDVKKVPTFQNLPPRKTPIYVSAFSPDGRWLAAGGGEEHGYGDERGTVTLWDLRNPKTAPRVLAAHNGVHSLAWKNDNRTLAVGCGNTDGYDEWGEIQLWDAPTAKLQRYLLGHKASVTGLAWNKNTLLAASRGDLKSWILPKNLQADGTIKPARERDTGASGLALIGNGQTFQSTGRLGEIEVRRTRDYSLVATLISLPQPEPPRNTLRPRVPLTYLQSWIAFTPDGFYTGSPDCEQWIRWRVGDELFSAAKFKAQFRRPEKVRAALQSKS